MKIIRTKVNYKNTDAYKQEKLKCDTIQSFDL